MEYKDVLHMHEHVCENSSKDIFSMSLFQNEGLTSPSDATGMPLPEHNVVAISSVTNGVPVAGLAQGTIMLATPAAMGPPQSLRILIDVSIQPSPGFTLH